MLSDVEPFWTLNLADVGGSSNNKVIVTIDDGLDNVHSMANGECISDVNGVITLAVEFRDNITETNNNTNDNRDMCQVLDVREDSTVEEQSQYIGDANITDECVSFKLRNNTLDGDHGLQLEANIVVPVVPADETNDVVAESCGKLDESDSDRFSYNLEMLGNVALTMKSPSCVNDGSDDVTMDIYDVRSDDLESDAVAVDTSSRKKNKTRSKRLRVVAGDGVEDEYVYGLGDDYQDAKRRKISEKTVTNECAEITDAIVPVKETGLAVSQLELNKHSVQCPLTNVSLTDADIPFSAIVHAKSGICWEECLSRADVQIVSTSENISSDNDFIINDALNDSRSVAVPEDSSATDICTDSVVLEDTPIDLIGTVLPDLTTKDSMLVTRVPLNTIKCDSNLGPSALVSSTDIDGTSNPALDMHRETLILESKIMVEDCKMSYNSESHPGRMIDEFDIMPKLEADECVALKVCQSNISMIKHKLVTDLQIRNCLNETVAVEKAEFAKEVEERRSEDDDAVRNLCLLEGFF